MFASIRGLRITLMVLASVAAVKSLSCSPCEKYNCQPVTCMGETVTDACGCCPVCAKMLNEPCGGPWRIKGICNSNLQCNLHGQPLRVGDQRDGICGLRVEKCYDKYPTACDLMAGKSNGFCDDEDSDWAENCRKTCGRCMPQSRGPEVSLIQPDDENICNLPLKIGHCGANVPSFYYNSREKYCVPFHFRGCGANKNNFWTIEECQQKCGGDNSQGVDLLSRRCKDERGELYDVGSRVVMGDGCNWCSCVLEGANKYPIITHCSQMTCGTTYTKKPETSAAELGPAGLCDGKSWPLLVGKTWNNAKAAIMHDCPNLYVWIWETKKSKIDFERSNRVHLIVDEEYKVVNTPTCCS